MSIFRDTYKKQKLYLSTSIYWRSLISLLTRKTIIPQLLHYSAKLCFIVILHSIFFSLFSRRKQVKSIDQEQIQNCQPDLKEFGVQSYRQWANTKHLEGESATPIDLNEKQKVKNQSGKFLEIALVLFIFLSSFV